MRTAIVFVLVPCFVAACSSSAKEPPAPSPSSQTGSTSGEDTTNTYDAGQVPASYAVQIQGAGHVATVDHSVDCTSDGTATTGKCTAQFGDTIYAGAALHWGFDHWEPTNSTDFSLMIGRATPPTITAVFVDLPSEGVRDGGR